MLKQKQELGQSQSRKRVKTVLEEQQALSKAFQVNNFYTNQRLNILELKRRLQLFKRGSSPQPLYTPQKKHCPKLNQKFPDQTEVELIEHQNAEKYIKDKVKQSITKKNVNRSEEDSVEKTKQRFLTEGNLRKEDRQEKEQAKQANHRIVKEIQKGRYESKIKTAFATRQNPNATPVDTLLMRKNPVKNSRQKTEYSKCSSNSLSHSWLELGVEGRIKIENSQQLHSLQEQILVLWQHYQLLTRILLGLKQGDRQEKSAIVRYIEDVCSQKIQFIMQLIYAIQRQYPSKDEASFMKHLKKGLILSKLYENLSVVYVSLLICLQNNPDANLVNFLGYCCSNVVFLLKFVLLCHSIAHPLNFSIKISEILTVISQFEHDSYKMRVERMGDLVLRIQHNNEVLAMLQTKICVKMGKDFQYTVASFLKPLDDSQVKTFLQYAHYIFEFLSFHLARSKIVGQFSSVEMAPCTYLTLPRQRTLVIQPCGVLFALRGSNNYIRAYSQIFLTQMAKHWNIVYWTDLMPDQVDDLLLKLPQGEMLYRYHCRYENQRFLKLLWRIGCDIDNTIIIDRYDRQMGLQMPWSGKSKDTRLIEVLHLLLPLLSSNPNTPLRKIFPQVKEQILNLDRKSKQRRRMVAGKGNGSILRQRKQGISSGRIEQESMYPRLLFRK